MSNADVVANETIPAALIHPSPVQPGRPWAGILLALLGAIAFSGKAIIVKLGYRYGADAVTLLVLRMLVALPFFALMAAWVRRDAQRFRLHGSDRWKVVGLGFCGYYLASFLDFAGLEFITATLERLILYLTPTLVLLLGMLVFRRRPSGRQLLALVLSYLGVAVAFAHDLPVGRRCYRAGRTAGVPECAQLCGLSGRQWRSGGADRRGTLDGVHQCSRRGLLRPALPAGTTLAFPV